MSYQSSQKELRRKMEDEERRIPVFTVLKNGAILKNIFVVNYPSAVDNVEEADRASEEILNVGRHQDCHILLTHPSISRFHLRIFSNPSSQKLSVMDLSSVHGTWVNDTKIEPGIRVELNEGDTLRVGGSRRIHKLHWVPLNQAYDVQCSFLSELDGSLVQEKEEEAADNSGLTVQVNQENPMTVEHGDYEEYKDSLEEIDRDILAAVEDKEETAKIEGKTVEAYWDDLLKIDCEEFGEYKYQLEDIDQEILATIGEGEVMETAKVGEIVTVDQDDPMKVEHEDYEEYKDSLEERDRDILAAVEDKEETAKIEGKTVQAYWDDLLKIDCGEFEEYKYPLEDTDQEILAIGEGEVTETAKVGKIVTADQTANEEEVNEEINQGMLESTEEVVSLDMTFEGLGSQILNESCGLLVKEETPMRMPVPQKMESSSSDGDVEHISAESNNLKQGDDCIACSKFAFPECMTFSLPPEILSEAVDLKSDKEERFEVGIATESALDIGDNNISRPQNEDSGSYLADGSIGEFDSRCSSFLSSKVLEETKWQKLDAENAVPLPHFAPESERLSEIDNLGDSTMEQTVDIIETANASLGGQGNHSASKVHEDGESQNMKVEEHDGERSNLSTHLEYPESDMLRDSMMKRSADIIESADASLGGQGNHSASKVHEDGERENMEVEVHDEERSNLSIHLEDPESEMLSEIDNLKDSTMKLTTDTTESADASLGGQANHSASKVHEDDERQNMEVEVQDQDRSHLCIHLEDEDILGQDILSDVTAQQLNEENQTLLFSFSRGNMPFTESSTPSLWSRRGKPATVLQLQSGKKSRKSRSAGFNAENRQQIKENTDNIFVVRDLAAELDREKGEIFTPEKEILTPNTQKVKFMKEIGKFGGVESWPLGGFFQPREDAFKEYQTPFEENLVRTLLSESILNQAEQISNSNSCRGSNIYLEEDVLHSSAKENQTPKVATENKQVKFASGSCSRLVNEISEVKGRTNLPFQSVPGDVTRGSNAVKSNRETGQKVSAIVPKVATEKKTWIMVADTSSFLDKESRKSLQLLQGLRGTQLIIPRTATRELDSLKQKFSLFRTNTEAASALEWIEEAMVVEDSKWWIHIHSSAEEEKRSGDSEEDHVLDYALFFKRTNANAKIVLLTNDISLKIKAMTEGLLCETPQEFRSILVNPFSDRFMWASSSPRGRTWSCLDDVVLKESYCKFHSQRNAAKGLKLILLHNGKWY